jgi:hypothetical protein
MSGGLLAGVAALAASPAEAGVAEQDTLVAGAIAGLERTIERLFDRQFEREFTTPWRGVSRVRDQLRVHVRSSGRYPEFLEVGLQVWESVYDWHVLFQQPLSAVRLADGRCTMTFMFTTLLLRPDLDPDHVGYPFDGDRRQPAP